jgi:hypothetical protein
MENNELIAELNHLCGNDWAQLPNGKFSIPCPREHDLKPPFNHPNIIYGVATEFGSCDSCGLKTRSITQLISILEAKFEAQPAKRVDMSGAMPHPFPNDKAGAPAILPTIYSWKDFSKHEFPWANQWRVKGLIPISARCVIAAPSGEGKSWLAMEMARCVAAGTPYLGNPAFATTHCKVLYIENETAKYDFQRRGKRLNFHEIEENIFTLLDDFPTLRDKKNAEALHVFAVQNGIGLIIIDTFRSVAGGIMEEKAEEIRRIFDNLKPFMESGITVVILDHTRKPHLNEGGLIPKKEQLLGSQDKFSAPEAVIMLRTKPVSKAESGSTANIFIHPLKNKGGVEAKPFQVDIVHVDDPDGGGMTTLTYVSEIDAKVLQAAVTEDAINDYLAGQTERQPTAEIVEALKGRAGKSSIETKLKELREAKKVGFTKEGSKFLYWSLGDEDASGDDMPSLFEDKPAS